MGNQDSLTIQLRDLCLDVDTAGGQSRRILQQTTLEISEPRVAVIGANGSGKSTLLRLIAGLVAPTHGTVSFSTPAPPRSGFIFANPQAQLVMPVVGEDIGFSLRHSIKDKAERRRRTTEILQQLGLADRIDSSVYELSSGEAQKVALAGVLAAEPQLVLADEPTTLLDLRNAAQFQRRLLELPVPLIYATHDLEFAARADRVLVFDEGRVIHQGEPTEAITAYRRLALKY